MSYWIAGLLVSLYLITLTLLCLPRGRVIRWIVGK